MSKKLQIKRGLQVDLPILAEGELGFTTDSKDLYIGTSDGNQQMENVRTLTHAKVGTVHQLSGTIATSGIGSINFNPTADFEGGDTFAINNVEYTAFNTLGEPVSGFKIGIPVSAQVNVGAKIIAIGGGGSMKGTTIAELGRSNVFGDATTAQWTSKSIPTSTSFQAGAIKDNLLYTITNNGELTIRNLDDYTFTVVTFPVNYDLQTATLFFQNNELYAFGRDETTDTDQKIVLYKLNISTKTRTFIASFTFDGVPLFGIYTHNTFIRLTDTKVMFSTSYKSSLQQIFLNFMVYDFLTQEFKSFFKAATAMLIPDAYYYQPFQFDNLGNVYIGLIKEVNKMLIYKMNIETLQYTSSLMTSSQITDSYMQAISSIPVGNKLMFISIRELNGAYVGELDLINETINTTLYNEPAATPLLGTSYVYKDAVLLMRSNSVQSLPLSQSPPQDNARAYKLFKGQEVNVIAEDPLTVIALSTGQPELVLTKTPQVLTQNYDIYWGGYQADVPIKIAIVNN